MKKSVRILSFLLILLFSVSALCACQPESVTQPPEAETPEDPSTHAPEAEVPALLDPEQANIVADNHTTQYLLVCDDDASSATQGAITRFRDAFLAKTGTDLRTVKDTTPTTAKEIIFGVMDGRAESLQVQSELTAPNGKGYRIGTVGEKIVLVSDEEYLTEAVNLLLRAICDCGDGVWGIPKDYVGSLEIPYLQADGTLYPVGQGNYAYNVTEISSMAVQNFVNRFEQEYFEKTLALFAVISV